MNKRTPPPLPARIAKSATSKMSRRDREFLPAAIEILETPPPPLPMVMMLAICAFFALALAWSFIGRLDVDAVAPGKIETAGRARVVQPLDSGKVLAIHVENGGRVHAGDLLIEMDPAEAEADEAAQRDAEDANRAEAARRRFAIERALAAMELQAQSEDSHGAQALALLEQAAMAPNPPIAWDETTSAEARKRERAVLTADLNQLVDSLQNLDQQIAQKEATVQRLNMSIAFQNALMQTLTDRVSTRQEAIDLKVGTKINLYDAKEELQKAQSALASDQGELIETDAALKEVISQKTKTLAQFVADNENKAADAARKVDQAKEAAAKAAARLARTRLYSPIDGVVQQMAVTTVGQVVTTGQQLLVVAPIGEALQVDALVANVDIGFVRPGQDAVVKVDAFPFTRFGVLHGKVVRIASEAIDEQEAKRTLANATSAVNAANMSSTTAPGQPQSFVFPITVALDEDAVKTGDASVPLAPGMTVSVEIKTDSRRVIDYLISPIAKVASEAMRER